MFFKIINFKKFVNFRGKHVCWVFFNKVAGPQNCNFIKRRLQHRYFAVNFVNCSKTPLLCRGCMTAGSETPVRLFKNTFFNRTFPVATSDSFRFPPAAFLKKGLQQRRCSVRFAKFLRSFYKTPPNNCFFCLLVILRSFPDHPFF